MDIDKRLEALTQTVELLASMHGDTEKAITRSAMATLADGMALLARRTIDHSGRIEKLEDNQAH